MAVLNAFQTVRPRGPDRDIPALPPRKTNRSKAPVVGNVHMALDRNSRRTVSLEPKAGSIVIESAQDSAASVAKRQRIARGVK